MQNYWQIFENNKKWVKAKVDSDPAFFKSKENEQHPNFLWIGCADSRVVPEAICGAEPGEIFVHRNIANLVVHTDLNMLSVVYYAVTALAVNHIIVCGHYNCGGIKGAMGDHDYGPLNDWLRNIKDVYHLHESELKSIESESQRWRRLVELNVKVQLMHLAQTSIIQRSWISHKRPTLHGCVYDIATGTLKDLMEVSSETGIDKIYSYNLAAAVT